MRKQTKTLLWVIGGFIALVVIARYMMPLIFASSEFRFPHMFTGMWFVIGTFGRVVFWVAVIYFVYTLLIQDRPTRSRDDELSILKERLAKGEISIEEYERIKKKMKEDD